MNPIAEMFGFYADMLEERGDDRCELFRQAIEHCDSADVEEQIEVVENLATLLTDSVSLVQFGGDIKIDTDCLVPDNRESWDDWASNSGYHRMMERLGRRLNVPPVIVQESNMGSFSSDAAVASDEFRRRVGLPPMVREPMMEQDLRTGRTLIRIGETVISDERSISEIVETMLDRGESRDSDVTSDDVDAEFDKLD